MARVSPVMRRILRKMAVGECKFAPNHGTLLALQRRGLVSMSEHRPAAWGDNYAIWRLTDAGRILSTVLGE